MHYRNGAVSLLISCMLFTGNFQASHDCVNYNKHDTIITIFKLMSYQQISKVEKRLQALVPL